jgi:hypothetical protein
MKRIPEGHALVRIEDLARLQEAASRPHGGQLQLWSVDKNGQRHQLFNVGLAVGMNRVLDPRDPLASPLLLDGSALELSVSIL